MAELITTSPAIDFEEIATFQRRACGEDWLKTERRRSQYAEYYRWKYGPRPSKPYCDVSRISQAGHWLGPHQLVSSPLAGNNVIIAA